MSETYEILRSNVLIRNQQGGCVHVLDLHPNSLLTNEKELQSLIAAANRAEALTRRVEELEGAEKLLREWFNLHDYPCRKDHHGNCQEHFLQTDCIVTRTRAALAAKGVQQ